MMLCEHLLCFLIQIFITQVFSFMKINWAIYLWCTNLWYMSIKLKTINGVSKEEDMKKTYLQLKSYFAQQLYQI